MWQEALAEFRPVLYTGSETLPAKRASVAAFCQGRSRVMMISLRSGAGLDGLQHYCNDVVFGELDWSPQVHHQVIGRLRRPGQTLQVNAHYLHTEEGSDPVLIETLGIKSDQARGLNDPGKEVAARHSDGSRIRKLAEAVLAQQGAVASAGACELCGSREGSVKGNIIPLESARDFEPGPERDMLFSVQNEVILCAEHESCRDASILALLDRKYARAVA
jgi:hypothetical protein